jgi:hypothetical protein
MDERPFFEFNMLDIKESAVEELKKFSKSIFDLDYILNTAGELKYTREIKRLLLDQMQEPTDEFVRFFASRVYSGRMTQGVREQFAQLTKQAFKQLLNDQINERLKTALASDPTGTAPPAVETPALTGATMMGTSPPEHTGGGAGTTADEWEGYHIVRAILREIVPAKRIAIRDVHSYCGILLDDNNRKPICRLHFNSAQKCVSFFDTEREERIPIDEIDDLYKYTDRLKAAVACHDTEFGPQKTTP